ncbi:hypothetical protein KsCSTR_36020 [Candidatus Kuenenia stuttgartiensis]|uniref:Uncharacterized protein n=1 Tax=Kuenenia stuttgartiensis TaxID=174633 RepID=A0A6G7GU47_KUEST|nr:hypothetical protein KsCSTR_36020 [Candidatus Kuenenia stuttgartiensis]
MKAFLEWCWQRSKIETGIKKLQQKACRESDVTVLHTIDGKRMYKNNK